MEGLVQEVSVGKATQWTVGHFCIWDLIYAMKSRWFAASVMSWLFYNRIHLCRV